MDQIILFLRRHYIDLLGINVLEMYVAFDAKQTTDKTQIAIL